MKTATPTPLYVNAGYAWPPVYEPHAVAMYRRMVLSMCDKEADRAKIQTMPDAVLMEIIARAAFVPERA